MYKRKIEKKEVVKRRQMEYARRAAIALPTDSDPIREVIHFCNSSAFGPHSG